VSETSLEPDSTVTVIYDAEIERTAWKVTLPGYEVQMLVASAITWSHGTTLHLYRDSFRMSEYVRALVPDKAEAHAIAQLHASLMAKVVAR
jgi:hypothetical protein